MKSYLNSVNRIDRSVCFVLNLLNENVAVCLHLIETLEAKLDWLFVVPRMFTDMTWFTDRYIVCENEAHDCFKF